MVSLHSLSSHCIFLCLVTCAKLSGAWFSGEKDLDFCAVERAQKCNYNIIGFIVLKEVSALHFGRTQHKRLTTLRAVCLSILTVPQRSGPRSLEKFKSFFN